MDGEVLLERTHVDGGVNTRHGNRVAHMYKREWAGYDVLTHFDRSAVHHLTLDLSVKERRRAFASLSWVRVQDAALSPLHRVACGTSPYCHGPMAVCQHVLKKDSVGSLSSSERPWGLCMDYTPPAGKCLVYSVGIRDIYSNELLIGRAGCEVHAFDCTVDLPV